MMFTHLAIDLADWTNGEWSDFYGCCMRFRNLPCSVMLAADAIAADHGLLNPRMSLSVLWLRWNCLLPFRSLCLLTSLLMGYGTLQGLRHEAGRIAACMYDMPGSQGADGWRRVGTLPVMYR